MRLLALALSLSLTLSPSLSLMFSRYTRLNEDELEAEEVWVARGCTDITVPRNFTEPDTA